MDLTGDSYSM